jgi:hypothetical protein
MTLSAERLLEGVTSELDLDDFGADRLPGDLGRTVEALNDEVPITPEGAPAVEEWITRSLRNTLLMQRDLAAHPEILDEELAPPIVVTGFPRTGTTKLQRIVSASPATQALSLPKLLNPAPIPHRDAFAEQVTAMMREAFPDFWAAHPIPHDQADEDMAIHDMTFASATVGMRHGAWRLMEERRPTDPWVFEFLRTTLKYLQWQDGSPGRSARSWVLKCPTHIGNVATVRSIFPGAKYVFCHRELETAMASLCRLVELAIGMVAEPTDRTALGEALLAYWSGEWGRCLEQRAELDTGSYLDLRFEEITRDGVAAAERVHELAGLSFDAAARAAAEAWEAANPRHSGGRHVYQLSDYGLTPDRVRSVFAAYYSHFGETMLVS